MTGPSGIDRTDAVERYEDDISAWIGLVRFMQMSARWQGTDPRTLRGTTTGYSRATKHIASVHKRRNNPPAAVNVRRWPSVLRGAGSPDESGSSTVLSTSSRSAARPVLPPPPPPPGPVVGSPLPRPPPPGAAPPPPPGPGAANSNEAARHLQNLPKPTRPTRCCPLPKVPENDVWAKDCNNLWRRGFEGLDISKLIAKLNLPELETRFERKRIVVEEKQKITPQKSRKFLDAQRTQTIGINLRFLKLPSADDLIESIESFKLPESMLQGTEEQILDNLWRLRELVPNDVELMLATEFDEETSATLAAEELFCFKVSKVPSFRAHVLALSLSRSFDVIVKSVCETLDIFVECCKRLMDSDYLREFMLSCLIAANYLNDGYLSQRNASGFYVEDFDKFAGCKSNEANTTLLDSVVRSLLKSDGGRLTTFVAELLEVSEKGKRIYLDDARTECASLRERIEELEAAFPEVDEKHKEEARTLLEKSRAKVNDLSSKVRAAGEAEQQLGTYVCEIKTQRNEGGSLARFDSSKCFESFNRIATAVKASITKNEAMDADRRKKNPLLPVV